MSRRGRLVIAAYVSATAACIALAPMGWNPFAVLGVWIGSTALAVQLAVFVDVLWPKKTRVSVVQPRWEGSTWARGSVSYRVGEVDRWQSK